MSDPRGAKPDRHDRAHDRDEHEATGEHTRRIEPDRARDDHRDDSAYANQGEDQVLRRLRDRTVTDDFPPPLDRVKPGLADCVQPNKERNPQAADGDPQHVEGLPDRPGSRPAPHAADPVAIHRGCVRRRYMEQQPSNRCRSSRKAALGAS